MLSLANQTLHPIPAPQPCPLPAFGDEIRWETAVFPQNPTSSATPPVGDNPAARMTEFFYRSSFCPLAGKTIRLNNIKTRLG
ncbi:MAG: hypothetical protein GY805_21565 [Chloroflexi bacterium]|nr:hypothetical protein [Chloroflexota bacterium]